MRQREKLEKRKKKNKLNKYREINEKSTSNEKKGKDFFFLKQWKSTSNHPKTSGGDIYFTRYQKMCKPHRPIIFLWNSL